jgi:hypothetical protein
MDTEILKNGCNRNVSKRLQANFNLSIYHVRALLDDWKNITITQFLDGLI